MTDHRQNYTPADLLTVGSRMTDRYTVDDAVEDYMAMHPEADAAAVRAEVEACEAGYPQKTAP